MVIIFIIIIYKMVRLFIIKTIKVCKKLNLYPTIKNVYKP